LGEHTRIHAGLIFLGLSFGIQNSYEWHRWQHGREERENLRRIRVTREQLSEEDWEHHDQHDLGQYGRNINSGYPTFFIFLEGNNGPQ
jgi:hypothetical protein